MYTSQGDDDTNDAEDAKKYLECDFGIAA